VSVDIVIIPRPYVLIFEACQARLQLTCCKIIISSGMFNDPKDVTAKIKIQQEPTAATSARPPNILYLVLDQWRYDWDGHHPDTPTGPLPLNVPFLWDMGQRSTRFTRHMFPVHTALQYGHALLRGWSTMPLAFTRILPIPSRWIGFK
jgi:hypothetical protein